MSHSSSRASIVKNEKGNYILIENEEVKLCLFTEIMLVHVENIWWKYPPQINKLLYQHQSMMGWLFKLSYIPSINNGKF